MKPRKLDKIIEELHPKQRDGLTIDGEDVGNMPTPPTTSQLIGHLGHEDKGGRIPKIRFVAEEDPTEVWSLGDDRVMGGMDVTVTPELRNAMQAGYVCMRCYEPQDDHFPEQCALCGYGMRSFQIRDMALEFKGDKHLGPSEPISAHLDRLEEEHLKKKFEKQIAGGKSPMKGLRHAP